MKKLWIDKRFWAALLTVVVAVAAQFLPGFDLPTEDLAGLVIVVAGFMLGVTLDANSAPGWAGIVKSRKFWAAAVGIVFILLRAFHVQVAEALTPDVVITLCVTLGGYAAAVGADGRTR